MRVGVVRFRHSYHVAEFQEPERSTVRSSDGDVLHPIEGSARATIDDDSIADLIGLLRAVAISKFEIPSGDADELVHDVFVTFLRNPSSVYGDPRR